MGMTVFVPCKGQMAGEGWVWPGGGGHQLCNLQPAMVLQFLCIRVGEGAAGASAHFQRHAALSAGKLVCKE